MTAYAIVLIQMKGEFKLFNVLMRSERFYKKDQRRVAAKVSHSVDFTAFVKEWTSGVHFAAAENWDKNNKIYCRLPEQLEKHHQAWVKIWGDNTTLSNTEIMREKFTKIVTSKKESTIQRGMFY